MSEPPDAPSDATDDATRCIACGDDGHLTKYGVMCIDCAYRAGDDDWVDTHRDAQREYERGLGKAEFGAWFLNLGFALAMRIGPRVTR